MPFLSVPGSSAPDGKCITSLSRKPLKLPSDPAVEARPRDEEERECSFSVKESVSLLRGITPVPPLMPAASMSRDFSVSSVRILEMGVIERVKLLRANLRSASATASGPSLPCSPKTSALHLSVDQGGIHPAFSSSSYAYAVDFCVPGWLSIGSYSPSLAFVILLVVMKTGPNDDGTTFHTSLLKLARVAGAL
eukprot:CAMPEP_0206261650 /NCGR_PEP_ID=MMETSP0047_2-20121206/27776_1 /ASSEMBLY_ACC=CAM_ASM_000192 /TAXON_ID=195065 /ORGANISM="Chroomonas mesostigmatica_cf, Strain CCMP1168" /LENGTH=192 /DNA_ID=CAMNT_0053688895 /DNA_START=324 /DNA_END=902 /DNA_ORIENTATION=+